MALALIPVRRASCPIVSCSVGWLSLFCLSIGSWVGISFFAPLLLERSVHLPIAGRSSPELGKIFFCNGVVSICVPHHLSKLAECGLTRLSQGVIWIHLC